MVLYISLLSTTCGRISAASVLLMPLAGPVYCYGFRLEVWRPQKHDSWWGSVSIYIQLYLRGKVLV